MKRIAMSALLFAFLAGPVAQVHAEDKENPYVKTREQQKKEGEDSERAYQKTLKATRGADSAPVKNDPWADMRGGTNASKSK
jgi:Ni/Co efflux regulator RcnB